MKKPESHPDLATSVPTHGDNASFPIHTLYPLPVQITASIPPWISSLDSQQLHGSPSQASKDYPELE